MSTYSPLLTDQYQLVMAYSYWKLGLAEREAVFHLSFRKLPLQSSFILTAGLQSVVEFVRQYQFTEEDLAYLKSQKTNGNTLFPDEFLDYLKNLTISCDIDAVPEGSLLFAQEPLLRIKGPILQCQLLETPLLNLINFASLIATKASQVNLAAKGDPVIEFGLRRAQGPNGGLTASRSAYIGGCSGTSNTLAGERYGIPLYGTQAHSWIMAFDTEMEAFTAFAESMPTNASLLVDTYDTVQGIKNAIEVGQQLRKEGKSLSAIRLDSGNLLELSRKARYLLNKAELADTKIMASGDLDEHIIRVLKANDAPIDTWGVGTRLVTAYDQPALNAIYKLSAMKNSHSEWQYKMKISNDNGKLTLPGILQVCRYYENDIPIKDVIFDVKLGEESLDENQDNCQTLLVPIFKKGQQVIELPDIHTIRHYAMQQVAAYANWAPKPYPVIIGARLQQAVDQLKESLKP